MKRKSVKTVTSILLLICLLIPTLVVSAAEEDQTPSGIPFSELESQIDAVVSENLGKTTPGAAIAVVHNGEIVFSKGYGYAYMERGIPIDPATTVFTYASVGKLFVWVSAMQLVEQGLLDLDADIAIYLPDDFVRRLNLRYTITMRDLMNHSAGFEQVALNMGVDTLAEDDLISLGDALLTVSPRRQIFEPGTVSGYSNYGVALAAYVIEQISGQGYADFERENIFLPVGIPNVLNLPDRINNSSFMQLKANNYSPNFQGGFNNYPSNIEFAIWPAGSANGTAEELAHFLIALTPPIGESGPLFNNHDSLTRIFTPSSINPDSIPGTHHGFWRYNGTVSAFGHAGHSYHFSNFVIVPEERFGFLSISNGQEDVNVAISHLLLGHNEVQASTDSGGFPSATSVEGHFRLAQGLIKSNFVSLFMNLAPADTVTAIDENTIELNTLMFGTARYHQIEPYVYRIISPEENPGLALYFNNLRFQMIDGSPVQIHVGDGKDFLVTPEVSMSALSLTGLGVSAMFFLVFPIALFIVFLVNRKKSIEKTRFRMFSNCFLLSGTLIAFNNLILLVRFIAISMETYPTTAMLTAHIWINYLIAGISVLMFVVSLLSTKGTQIRARRLVMFGITAFLLSIMVITMVNLKLFAFL